jgi:hypothetical protein
MKQAKPTFKDKNSEIAGKLRSIAHDVRGDEGRTLLNALARDIERGRHTPRKPYASKPKN